MKYYAAMKDSGMKLQCLEVSNPSNWMWWSTHRLIYDRAMSLNDYGYSKPILLFNRFSDKSTFKFQLL